MSKKDQDSSKIYNYLMKQNRPYSLNDIFLNLHKEIGKTAVQKVLDSLCEDGSVKEKTYGKQKVYLVNQDSFPSLDEGKLKEMDCQINNLSEELKAKSKELIDCESKLRSVNSSLTTEEAQEKILKLEHEIASAEESVSKLKGGNVMVSQQEKERVECDREKMLKEWKKRRRMALDVLDAILEGYPKSKKELYEEVGIETDEDAGVNLSSFS